MSVDANVPSQMCAQAAPIAACRPSRSAYARRSVVWPSMGASPVPLTRVRPNPSALDQNGAAR